MIPMTDAEANALLRALSSMLGAPVLGAAHESKQLQGGTLGDVRLVYGTSDVKNKGATPFSIVWKKQKKWHRPGDPGSWRREYDLYTSDFGRMMSDALRWPACYHAEFSGDEIQLWMEAIEGASGNGLPIEALEQAALEMGRLQGRVFAKPGIAKDIPAFGDTGYMKRDYTQWHKGTHTYAVRCSDAFRVPDHVRELIRRNPWDNDKTLEYNYLRFAECSIPDHLKRMIIQVDDRMEDVFGVIERLPVVLCHRDFWLENILFSCGQIRVIDWDMASWGYIGEDIASLVSDDIDYAHFEEYCRHLIPAYRRGLSESMDVSALTADRVREMILIKFGYRMVQAHLFAKSAEEKERLVHQLQKIHNMRDDL